MKTSRKTLAAGALAGTVALLLVGAYRLLASSAVEKPEEIAPVQVNNQILRYPPGAPQLAYLKIEPVVSLPVPTLEPLNGRIAYDDNVTARITSPIAGRVVRVAVQAGDPVSAGEPLLWLDSPDYAQALADLRKAQADLAFKRHALERARTLYEGGALARKDLEAAEDDALQSEAEAQRARSRYRNLNPSGRPSPSFALRAPISGIVTERQASPGTEVRPDAASPLFVVSDPTRLWVLVELPEKDLGKLQPGQSVAVEVDAYPGKRFSARVAAIGDVVDPATRRVTVRCTLANPQRQLKPEMYARVTPLSEGPRLPRVPNTAIVTEGLHTYVFVETEPGVLEKRRVTLGYRGARESFVTQGVRAGERIVSSGALLLNSELAGN